MIPQRVPVILEITDKFKPTRAKNRPVTIRVLSFDTSMPFLQFECDFNDLVGAGGQMKQRKFDACLTASTK